MFSFSLRDATGLTQASWLAVMVVGLVSFLGIVGLRLQRRGAARFWAAPAALALVLLPAAVSALFAGLILRGALATMALTGAGGNAAIAAGTAEALTPLVLGLAAAAVLSACAFLTTAAGSSRSTAPPSGGAIGWSLLGAGLVALVLLVVTVATILGAGSTLNAITAPDRTLGMRVIVALAGACALVAATVLLAIVGAFVAPRGPAATEVKVVSLGAIVLCALMAFAGLLATWDRTLRLVDTATSGLADGELPQPHVPETPSAMEPENPPPPPPPPPPPRAGAVRAGGTIREPRKIRSVPPQYPLIAREARVQGVVILEATISPAGTVTAVRVLRGIPLLDAAAVEAVRQWAYEPTLLNGVPVPVIMTITVNFRLAAESPVSSP